MNNSPWIRHCIEACRLTIQNSRTQYTVSPLWVHIGSSVIAIVSCLWRIWKTLFLYHDHLYGNTKVTWRLSYLDTYTIKRCRDYWRSTTYVLVNAVSDKKNIRFSVYIDFMFRVEYDLHFTGRISNILYYYIILYIHVLLCSLDAMASEESRDNAYVYTAQTAYRSKPAYWPKLAYVFVVTPRQQRPYTNEMPVTQFPTTSRNTIRRYNGLPTRINEFNYKYFLFPSILR